MVSSWRLSFISLSVSRFLVGQAAVVLPTKCYLKSSGVEHASQEGPCGVVSPDSGFFSCCAIGDQCLDDGLCHFTHAIPVGSNSSRYYVGGCTDSTLADASCNPGCSNYKYQDVVFNKTSQTWFCCGAIGDSVSCDSPTTEVVPVHANKSSIDTTYVVPQNVATTAAPSTTGVQGSSPTTAQSSSIPTKSSSGGAPVGAITGGVVGSVALVALVIGIWYFFRRRAKQRRSINTTGNGKLLPPQVEKAPDNETIEMDAQNALVELDEQGNIGTKRGRADEMYELQ